MIAAETSREGRLVCSACFMRDHTTRVHAVVGCNAAQSDNLWEQICDEEPIPDFLQPEVAPESAPTATVAASAKSEVVASTPTTST